MNENNTVSNNADNGNQIPYQMPLNLPQGVYNNVYRKPPVKVYPFNNKDFYFLIFSTVAAFLFARLGIINGGNLGFSLTYILLSVGMLIYVRSKECKNKLLYSVMFLIDVVLSLSFILHDNGGIKLLSAMVLFFTSMMTINGVSANSLCNDGTFLKLADILYIGIVEPLADIKAFFRSLKSAFKNKNNKFVMVFAGIIVSVPVLVVVIPLLSSADAAFNTIVEKVFSDSAMLVVSIILTVLLLPFIASYGFSLSNGIIKEKNKSFNSKPGKVSPIFLNTFLSIVGFIYIVFLVSQLAYISDAFSFLLPEEFSAAEFARSGFFQMGAIAFINLLITFIVSVIEKQKDNGRLPLSTKIILTFFTLFSVFLTVNAFIRMSMYIDMYGLTRLRVLTSVFMIMLCVIFVFVLIRIFNERFKYINFVIFTCAITMVLVSVPDIDSVISKYNYENYVEGKIGIDFEHFEALGNGGVPELIKIAENDKNTVNRYLARDTLADVLYTEFDYDIRFYDSAYVESEPFKYEKNIFEYNCAEAKAGKALESYFSKVRDKDFKVEYVDDTMFEYNSVVSEYSAEKFMPDFSNSYDDIYSVDFEYGSSEYNGNSLNITEMSIYYDQSDYKKAVGDINRKFGFSHEFELEGYTFKIVENNNVKNSIGIIAFSEKESTVAYLWAIGDSAISVASYDTFIKDVFDMNFVTSY